MNRLNAENAARQVSAESPVLTVRVGDKQWTVGDASKAVTSSERTANPHLEREADASSTAAEQPQRNDVLERLGAAITHSIEDLLEPAGRAEANLRGVRTNGRRKTPVKGFVVRRKRRWRDTFQFGCLVGLFLGCLCMILFHQMGPVSNASTTQPSGTAQPTVIASSNTPSFVVPAVRVQLLQSNAFASQAEVEKASESLKQHGVPAVVAQVHGRYVLWLDAALRSDHMARTAAQAKSLGVSASPVAMNLAVRDRPALAGAHVGSLNQISHWLSAEVSALTALTAVAADGGASQDAMAAYHAAEALRPSPDVLEVTGNGAQLTSLANHVSQAVTAYQKHDSASLEQHLLMAYEQLASLHGTA
ncbi:hypothetical protein GCM10025857_37110 [Alicyclobacillus contaminans]|uniref:hypothetical protein n=1 Tax=Alicyclobacillus contaminans TaxID=392016 RepID=UPI0003F9FC3F|nr:hypothetical protein [Alicyclobacillus contaminans]GMA52354.1 hypothetical protein GCM10025857_37110 [Alicyclobacillus contaminans]